MMTRKQVVQLGLVLLCLHILYSIAVNFPYPNPYVRPFLPPKLKYPELQIKEWVESGNFRPDFLAFFNRDPERRVPPGGDFVAPSDGVIKEIREHEGTTYLAIGLSFWDVHVVRTPVAGTVTNVEILGTTSSRNWSETNKLRFLDEKAAPVQAIVTLATAHGPIKVRLITSWWASRLKVSVRLGQNLKKGDRIGRILLGSSVVMDVPGSKVFNLKANQRVTAGETVILIKDSL